MKIYDQNVIIDWSTFFPQKTWTVFKISVDSLSYSSKLMIMILFYQIIIIIIIVYSVFVGLLLTLKDLKDPVDGRFGSRACLPSL